MPFMTSKEFEGRTSVDGALRRTKLKAIGTWLDVYNQGPSVEHLDDLCQALDAWKQAHSKKGSWQLDRRNVVKGKGHPVEELDEAIGLQYREEARQVLGQAVLVLDAAYGTEMDPTYRGHLASTFLHPLKLKAEPLQCFVWFREKATRGRVLWRKRVQNCGAWTSAQGETDGMTMPEPPTRINELNQWLDASKAGESAAVVGRYVTADNSAPRDRVIEVSTLKLHTVTHEMLHWVTHEAFRDYACNIKNPLLGKFLREGLTEWLTQKALNGTPAKSYEDMVPIWEDIMRGKQLTIPEIGAAIFRGQNVPAFCKKAETIANTNAMYKAAVIEAITKSL